MTYEIFNNAIRVTSKKQFKRGIDYGLLGTVHVSKKGMYNDDIKSGTEITNQRYAAKIRRLQTVAKGYARQFVGEYPDKAIVNQNSIRYTTVIKHQNRDNKGRFLSFKKTIEKFQNENKNKRIRRGKDKMIKKDKIIKKKAIKKKPIRQDIHNTQPTPLYT